MARPRLTIAPHLTHDEISLRDRACRSGLEKTRWQVHSRPAPIDLRHAPPDGGLWSGPKVAAYVRDRCGAVICKTTLIVNIPMPGSEGSKSSLVDAPLREMVPRVDASLLSPNVEGFDEATGEHAGARGGVSRGWALV